MSRVNEFKQALASALNIPETLSDAVFALPSDEPVRVWYEPGKVREIIEILTDRVHGLKVPTYIEFKTRDPNTGVVSDVRGHVTAENLVHLPRMIIHARSDIRIYAVYNELVTSSEAPNDQ
ncbi:hypothetical protein [Yersinia ruckeri]|uniref:hypothetical protein n=1 Tax=Yersinia ruckeri TaxID=29486 RepID=UPI00223792BC|nr:hypothetical protein [Yersinia ruckeri]MCW6598728.1 hypothetical protein [Yersinia ruckeri]